MRGFVIRRGRGSMKVCYAFIECINGSIALRRRTPVVANWCLWYLECAQSEHHPIEHQQLARLLGIDVEGLSDAGTVLAAGGRGVHTRRHPTAAAASAVGGVIVHSHR